MLFADESNFVIEQGFVDGFEVLAFERDSMTGEMEDELARFVELDSNKVGVPEGPAIASFENDIHSEGSLDIGRPFRSWAECREIGVG